MPVTTFSPPLNPSIRSSEEENFRVLKAQFGGGYSQRTADGPNSQLAKLQLRWGLLTFDQSEEIIQFLKSRGGWESFFYTLPGDTIPRRFISPGYKRTWVAPTIYAIQAAFEEVPDL